MCSKIHKKSCWLGNVYMTQYNNQILISLEMVFVFKFFQLKIW